eukprot:Skav206901  [mRNA]  locus=scaffold2387:346219:351372:+ [translate_table: standard]
MPFLQLWRQHLGGRGRLGTSAPRFPAREGAGAVVIASDVVVVDSNQQPKVSDHQLFIDPRDVRAPVAPVARPTMMEGVEKDLNAGVDEWDAYWDRNCCSVM